MMERAAGLALALLTLALTAAPQPNGLPRGWLWRDPGNIGALDFAGAVGAPVHLPKPPFTFLREDPSGTQPKLFARDAEGTTWNVKFGFEVHSESFCWRIVRACGYFAEPNFYVASGKFEGYHPLQRSTASVQPDGRFTAARFQFRDPNVKFLEDRNWYWDRPPFGGSRELSGLKILIMLLANWDNKDARVGGSGSGPNTAIFERRHSSRPSDPPAGSRSAAASQSAKPQPAPAEFIYAFTDWGAGMGSILGGFSGRSNWRCAEYSAQSPGFVQRVDPNQVVFQYDGAINPGFRTGIPPAHVVWLMQYLGRITDAQLRAGLKASGASDQDADCFTRGLRIRIEALRKVH